MCEKHRLAAESGAARVIYMSDAVAASSDDDLAPAGADEAFEEGVRCEALNFAFHDRDGDRKLSFDEFAALVHEREHGEHTMTELQARFEQARPISLRDLACAATYARSASATPACAASHNMTRVRALYLVCVPTARR